MATTREYQVTGSARLEQAAAIVRHAAPLARKNGIRVNGTSRKFCAIPWRVMLQETCGAHRIELFRGRRMLAASWEDNDTELRIEFLKNGDWIADLLRELH